MSVNFNSCAAHAKSEELTSIKIDLQPVTRERTRNLRQRFGWTVDRAPWALGE